MSAIDPTLNLQRAMFMPTLLLALLLGLAWNGAREPQVIVYGGTPQGVTAALAAARQGLRVTLIEPGPGLGGVVVRGWLATLDDTDDLHHRSIYGGLYASLYRALGSDRNVDVERTERLFTRLLGLAGVDVRLNTRLEAGPSSVERQGGVLRAVWVRHVYGLRRLAAGQFIDASDTADLAVRAGATFTVGREDGGLDRRQMAATLVLRLGGVRWHDVARSLRAAALSHREDAGFGAWGGYGFGLLAAGYTPSSPQFRLRGLNIARQQGGSLLVNALLIAGVDGTDPVSVARAHRQATLEAGRVVAFLRRADPQTFGQARLLGVAPDLYVRETRHLNGLVRLHADDVLMGRSDASSVATGGYALDGQIYDARESPFLLGRPAPYGVSYGTLVPVGLQNLLVVSQAASFDSAAAFSARVVPLQMVLGEAAGTACAVSRRLGLSLAGLSGRPLQLRAALLAGGNRLPVSPPEYGPPSEWRLSSQGTNPADQRSVYSLHLLRRGLLSAPYSLRGQLGAGQPILVSDFLSSLNHWLVARSSDPRQFQVMKQLRLWARHTPGQTLSWSGARAIFRWLHEDAWEVDLRAGLLRRGDAARLLTDMFPARDRQLGSWRPAPETALGRRGGSGTSRAE